jgi:hypothetical protein
MYEILELLVILTLMENSFDAKQRKKSAQDRIKELLFTSSYTICIVSSKVMKNFKKIYRNH